MALVPFFRGTNGWELPEPSVSQGTEENGDGGVRGSREIRLGSSARRCPSAKIHLAGSSPPTKLLSASIFPRAVWVGPSHKSMGHLSTPTPTNSPQTHLLMIQDAVCTWSLELLEAKDSLKVILPLLRLVHVCWQVAV